MNKYIKWAKLILKVITILPVYIEGIKSLINKFVKEINC